MIAHPHMEDAYALRVSDLLSAHAAGVGHVSMRRAAQPWSAGGQAEVSFKLTLGENEGLANLEYSNPSTEQSLRISDIVTLEATRPHYGGVRWWLRCPVTGRRASKLLLFPGEQRFSHRTRSDLRPTYLSQRVSGMDKVYRRLWALRLSIPGQGPILDPLIRPPRMHVTTYLKLLRRDEAIWNSQDNSLLDWLRSDLTSGLEMDSSQTI